MFVVKLYDEAAAVIHIGRFDDVNEAQSGAKKGLRYSKTAVVYEGETPVFLYNNESYPNGFELGVGSY
ncbi:hypothetical protein [Domibacillus epiphyticus]|uniref:Uncharacterized protein n=1 Tax=Domibacillus epiphyticus TaxID=1714355 RepID=A0A1V2A572_9BACI|nr:hypothetical protein [Domibacillus epiphyticus]OMP66133.1 hypothetical protein BTO28_14100 [Domibacillus epiphyticus]